MRLQCRECLTYQLDDATFLIASYARKVVGSGLSEGHGVRSFIGRSWGQVFHYHILICIQILARPLRLEFARALYHVTYRGDRGEDIYNHDAVCSNGGYDNERLDPMFCRDPMFCPKGFRTNDFLDISRESLIKSANGRVAFASC